MICASCGTETPADPCGSCGQSARLDGRYALIRALGHGTSGTTWLAETADGTLVAIKELRVTGDSKAIELISREARVLRELHHDAIPAYIDDFASMSGRLRIHCVVQQYIDGRTLAEVVANHRFSVDEAIAVLEKLLDPLEYLHARHPPVVHRDLKPANILVRPDGQVAIVDFGSVRDAWKGTFGGSTVAGTFGYMAPEQFAGDASPASDVFALGALLIGMLARKEPAELQDRNRRFNWRPHLRTTPAWTALIDAMVAEDPAERPGDALALRAAIRMARRSDPAPKPSGSQSRPPEWWEPQTGPSAAPSDLSIAPRSRYAEPLALPTDPTTTDDPLIHPPIPGAFTTDLASPPASGARVGIIAAGVGLAFFISSVLALSVIAWSIGWHAAFSLPAMPLAPEPPLPPVAPLAPALAPDPASVPVPASEPPALLPRIVAASPAPR